MIKDSLVEYCNWCGKPCGELSMDKLSQPFVTLHKNCYAELVETWHKYECLNK